MTLKTALYRGYLTHTLIREWGKRQGLGGTFGWIKGDELRLRKSIRSIWIGVLSLILFGALVTFQKLPIDRKYGLLICAFGLLAAVLGSRGVHLLFFDQLTKGHLKLFADRRELNTIVWPGIENLAEKDWKDLLGDAEETLVRIAMRVFAYEAHEQNAEFSEEKRELAETRKAEMKLKFNRVYIILNKFNLAPSKKDFYYQKAAQQFCEGERDLMLKTCSV